MTPNQYKAARRQLDELSRKEAVLQAQEADALQVIRDTFGDVELSEVSELLRERRDALKVRQDQFERQLKEAESVISRFDA